MLLQVSGDTVAIEFAGVRWLGTLDFCNARDVAVKEGSDRGWGRGRSNNGFCSAKVDCQMSFYTNQLSSCTQMSAGNNGGNTGGGYNNGGNTGGGYNNGGNTGGGYNNGGNNGGGYNNGGNTGGGYNNGGNNGACDAGRTRGDTNFWGADVAAKTTAGSARECCRLCAAHPQCGAWTWAGPNSGGAYAFFKMSCYLKQANGWTTLAAPGLISGTMSR